MFGGIGFQEILIIVVVGFLVFGATRLPKIARSLGQGIKEFKKSIKDTDEGEENRIEYVDQGQYNQPQQQTESDGELGGNAQFLPELRYRLLYVHSIPFMFIIALAQRCESRLSAIPHPQRLDHPGAQR